MNNSAVAVVQSTRRTCMALARFVMLVVTCRDGFHHHHVTNSNDASLAPAQQHNTAKNNYPEENNDDDHAEPDEAILPSHHGSSPRILGGEGEGHARLQAEHRI